MDLAPGQIAGSLFDVVDLPLGSRVVYTGACTIDSNATGTLVNTASVTMPPGGTDLNPLNDLATDADTVLERANDRYVADTITRQLADADLTLVSKADLVDPGR